MKRSNSFIKTRRDAPSDEQAKNAQLLIRAGYIHKEMAGVYAYLPMGKMVIDNISDIVREEINNVGAEEAQMSILQPKELWEKTNRWDDSIVDNWFKTKLKNGTELGVGLTHEEAVADALKDFIGSYKDLPIYIYQIQNKYRNELRAKSGLMRGREFIMKDLYSFSRSEQEHEDFYEKISQAYTKIYQRLGIGEITYPTYASGGYFSEFSREFQTISEIGEDTIYLDEEKRLAINKEVYDFKNIDKLEINKDNLKEYKAVEVGNIFPLGSKFTEPLGVYYVGEDGQKHQIIMGSYGIGISRLMGLLAEHFSDERGLSWPKNIAPYNAYLINIDDSQEVKQAADSLYTQLQDAGVKTIYDDRNERPGEKFADSDLMGIPYRLVVSSNTLQAGGVELKSRTSQENQTIPVNSVIETLAQ